MKKENPPAFPMQTDLVVNYGMTLRDYFAGKAMQGILANKKTDANAESIATVSYLIADAMLKQREL